METLQNPTKTKAIKEHKCNFCGEPIFKGETYSKSVHLGDSGIYSWKSHDRCDKLTKDLKMWDHVEKDGLTQDDFVESVREAHHDLMIQLLTPGNIGNSDILSQLRSVPFKQQYWFVVRHYNRVNPIPH